MRLVKLSNPPPNKRANHRFRGVIITVVLGGAVVFQLLRPLPTASVYMSLPPLPSTVPLTVAWPQGVSAALNTEEYGSLGASGPSQPIATASMAKVITALCVLEKQPLKLGETGPKYTLSQPDIDLYNLEIAHNGSRVGFISGQQISQYQALQAILIPSANNIANSLAVWTFGSQENYKKFADAYLLRHGLVNTHIGTDASGYDPSTISSAVDLAQIGILARQNPVIMQIAGQKSYTGPDDTIYTNPNTALGVNGINGLKTGNNDQNPGGLLFTADTAVEGKTVHVSGAVTGAASLPEAIGDSEVLVASLPGNFHVVEYVRHKQPIGIAKTAWGATVPVYTKSDLSLVRWGSQPLTERHTVHSASPTRAGSVGALSIQAGQQEASVTLETRTVPTGPSVIWRLTRLL